MITRRSFLQKTSLAAAAALIKPDAFNFNHHYIGLQLYTVRDAMQADPAAALAKIAAIGYNSVEGATYTGTEKFYGMDAKAFKALLKQNNLIMPSAHYRLGEDQEKGEDVMGTILHDWEKAVDDAASVGLKYMVCAWLSEKERGNIDHYKKIAADLNKAGEVCKKAGLQLCYHNHDFEFIKTDNQIPYKILITQTDKDLVNFETDLYWLTKAGEDPIELYQNHPGRFPLWHVKDMDKNGDHSFTEVGNGSIDFKKIFKYADKAGMKYFFVEQDKTPGDPFVSITESYKYIKQNLV